MFTKVGIKFHGRDLILEAGKVAKQASGSVVVRYGDTVILVTVTADKGQRRVGDFVPLTVSYQEKYYATGKIPGGFFKREGRPTDAETLNSRLIDRPIRPLFPRQWPFETQIMPTILSADNESHPGVISLIGASAALEISPIPFEGPVAAVQVGRIGGQWLINPSYAQLDECDVELVVAGNRDGIAMVEGGAAIVSEADLLEGIFYGYESLIPLLDLQDQLRQAVGLPKLEFESIVCPDDLAKKIETMLRADMVEACKLPGKLERHERIRDLREGALKKLKEEEAELGEKDLFFYQMEEKIEKSIIRGMIATGVRADGRSLDQVRPIAVEAGVLPRTHGSALFTRGETQAIVVATLGTRKDERRMERLEEDYFKTFYLHYNFPPYCVAEVSNRLQPGRREIGHGHLAERALARVLPDHDDFPYTLRVVSEITESNGSSSMATVCGGSLALMDAGIPIKGQVAGVAMGLVKEGEGKFHVITDIVGDEDHSGDMDFKVAGTADGVTAVQMDIKCSGLDREIMGKALAQAREARLHILGKMNEVIDRPRADLSPFAPRIVHIQIPVDKIRDIIGPGGKMIRSIVEQTGAEIDVEDDGTVTVASANMAANDKAIQIIRDLTAEAEIGMVYTGTVRKVTDFGAFVEIIPGTDGLVHISQLENYRVERVTDILHEGDKVVVKCIGIDDNGKISLSRKEVLDQQPEGARKPPPPRESRANDDGPPPRDSRPHDGPQAPRESRPFSGDRPRPGGGERDRGPKRGRDRR
jgi:polyribonucleotide nucleotidyltransferase